MSATKLADEYADIAQRLKEIEESRGKEAQESKLPSDIGEAAVGWPYMYQPIDEDFVC